MRLQQESASENRSTLTPCASGCFPLREANGSPFLSQSGRWTPFVAKTAVVCSAVAEIVNILRGFFRNWPDASVAPERCFVAF